MRRLTPFVLFVLFVLSVASRAADFYVDPATGDNTADGTSEGTAWKNIPGTTNITGAGWVQLVDGDTLWMKGGTTNIMVMLNTTYYSGASAFDSIQVRSGHLKSPQWGTTRAIIDCTNNFHSGFWIGNNTALRGVTVEGFEVKNIGAGGVGTGFDGTTGSACIDIGGSTAPGYITVRNCYLHDATRSIDDTGHGIEVSGAASEQFIFEKNTIGPNIGTKGIEVFRANFGRISQNFILAGNGTIGDHGIVVSGARWDVNGNIVSTADGVHDPIYALKVTGDMCDIWNNIFFGNTAGPQDISGVFFIQANDASGFGGSNRFFCNTVYRFGASGNFGEEGNGLVFGVVSGAGTSNNIAMNNLLTYSTNQAGGFNMSYDQSTRNAKVQYNSFYSGHAGNVISMGVSGPSNFTVTTWQALTFPVGTTNTNNVQLNPEYRRGTLPNGLNTEFEPNQLFFDLTGNTPLAIRVSGNSLAGLGNSTHGFTSTSTKFETDINGRARTLWSMGAYEIPPLPTINATTVNANTLYFR